MRSLWIGAALLGCLGVARAEGIAGALDCLEPGEMRETVADNKVVAPATAVVTARRAVPGAEIVRANLCRVETNLSLHHHGPSQGRPFRVRHDRRDLRQGQNRAIA